MGAAYFVIWKLPFWILTAMVTALVMLSVVAFVAGLLIGKKILIAGSDRAPKIEELPILYSFGLWPEMVTIYNWAFLIVSLYGSVALIVYFNILPRVAMGALVAWSQLDPRVRYSRGYANAAWQLHQGKDASPVNISKEHCARVAGAIVDILNGADKSWRRDRADAPTNISALGSDEKANLLLVGNVIEGTVHMNRLAPLPFAEFYAALVEIALQPGRLFAKGNILTHATTGRFYQTIRDAAGNKNNLFPDSAVVATDVDQVVTLLAGHHRGNAVEIATTWYGAPSLARAFRRLDIFPPMELDEPKCMAPQFLKLAVRWRVWPDIKTGPLMYGTRRKLTYSTSLIQLLFDTRCLVTTSAAKSLPNRQPLRRLAVRAQAEVAKLVGCIIERTREPELVALRNEMAGNGGDFEWKTFELVDYFLWHVCYRMGSDRSTGTGTALIVPPQWVVDDTRVTKR